MKQHKIAVIPGDGIGPEVIAAGLKVLNYINEKEKSGTFNYDVFDWGCEYYLKNKMMMPTDGIETLSNYQAIYLGAVGDPRVSDEISLWGLLMKIRQSFDQFVNYRPNKSYGSFSSFYVHPPQFDILFVRENVEGEYADCGGIVDVGGASERAIQENVFTKVGCQRIMRYAFQQALKRSKRLTSISKSNAQRYSMVYWDKLFNEIAQEYPEVQVNSLLIDAACVQIIKKPQDFDVIVCSNLFGDILTDLITVLNGGLGMAAGANLNPGDPSKPAMFEPIHGSAPRLAGKNKANPLATILALGLMLDYLGYPQWKKTIDQAVSALIADGRHLTNDLGGSASTSEVADEIINLLAAGQST